VFLAALGPLAEHSDRLMYAQNFFAAGGIDAASASVDAASLTQALKASGCSLACICGSDQRYAAEAADAARALKAAGVSRLYLAGRPGGREQELRAAGVDEFIHIGVDVLASLEQAHAELGLSR
jgi:methylmalonyl-CoA mutase